MSKPIDEMLASNRGKAKPEAVIGVPGNAIYGGYLQDNERSPLLASREERYRTYSDMLANSSIIAAGVRLYLSIISKSKWSFRPSEFDTDKRFAELTDSIFLNDPVTPWHRIVRRASMYRFYGFSVQEWTARLRDDGVITFADISPRPQITISRWDSDVDGSIHGVVQDSPQDGSSIYIPISKCLYLVDDSLNDSPEGLGLFRHLISLSKRLKRYEQLEGIGFENDLRGVPIGRGPFTELQQMVTSGKITNAQRRELEAPLRAFAEKHIRSDKLSMLLDSAVYQSQDDASSPSSQLQWDIDILKGGSVSFAENAAAIERINREMARVLGVEQLMLGSDSTGSFALSQDKSGTFLTLVDSGLREIVETVDSNLLTPIWDLNGWPKEMRPTIHTDSAQQSSIEQITMALRDLATAGVLLNPDDPVVNDLRDMMGVSKRPDDSLSMDIDASLHNVPSEDVDITA